MRAWLSCLVAIALLFVSTIAAQQAATIAHPSFLRSSPTNADPALGRLKAGDTVTLLGAARRQGYYHVQTSDGKEGWVWARNVATTNAAPTSPAPPPPPPAPPAAARGGGAAVAPEGVAAAAPRGRGARSNTGKGGTHGGTHGGTPGGTPVPGDEAIDTPSCQPTGTNKTRSANSFASGARLATR